MFRVSPIVVLLGFFAGVAQAQTIINVPPEVAPPSVGADTVLNLFSGGEIIGPFQANAGSVVNIAGGVVSETFTANDLSQVNISGGRIGPFVAREQSTVDLSGGTFADFAFWSETLSNIAFAGGDFRINGEMVSGLSGPGSTAPLEIPSDAVFSGVFADGTPFAFSRQESGSRLDGAFTLRSEALPAPGPTTITASTDAIPLGIRAGQTIVVDAGGELPDDFNAGWGSTVEIHEGGVVGHNLEATGATINMHGGESRGDMEVFYGGVLNMTDGVLNPSNDIFSGGVANISGGDVSRVYVWRDAEINLSGDARTNHLLMLPGSKLTVDDDASLFSLQFYELGHRRFGADVTTTVEVHGGYVFNTDGMPRGVDVLVTGGEITSLGMGADSTLLMTGGETNELSLSHGGRATVTGGQFDRGLTVHAESYAEISGGNFGNNSEILPDAEVAISGGTFGDRFTLHDGAVATVTGGSFGENFFAHAGSKASIANASFAYSLTTQPDSDIEIINSWIGHSARLEDATITLNGQDVGVDFLGRGVHLTMAGGAIGDGGHFENGSQVSLHQVTLPEGFQVDDSDFSLTGGSTGMGLRILGAANVTPNQVVFKDASVGPFSSIARVSLAIDGGVFESFASLVDLKAGSTISGASFSDGAKITGIVNISGSSFGNDFRLNTSASSFSQISLEGQSIGQNASLSGKIILLDGSIGDGMRVLSPGSHVTLAGGSIGEASVVGSSTLMQSGGVIEDGFALVNSEMTLSGGVVGENLRVVNGSTLHLIGSSFQLDGLAIVGLEPGVRTELFDRNITLTGVLADGSPFDFTLQTTSGGVDHFANSTVTLTLFEGLLGDYNADGQVDGGDYAAWRETLGEVVTPGAGADHDFSGQIDQGDYYVWRNHYGSSSPTPPPDATPEPTSLLLALLPAMAWVMAFRFPTNRRTF